MTTYIEYAKFFNLLGPAPLPEPLKSELSIQIEAARQTNEGLGYLFGSPSELTITSDVPLIFEITDIPIYARKVLVDYLLETFKGKSHV